MSPAEPRLCLRRAGRIGAAGKDGCWPAGAGRLPGEESTTSPMSDELESMSERLIHDRLFQSAG